MSYYIETDGKKKGTWEILRFNADRIRVGHHAGAQLRVKLPQRKVKIYTSTLKNLITLDGYLSEHGQIAFTESKIALDIYGELIAPVIELCKQPIANLLMPGTNTTFEDFFILKASKDFHTIIDKIVNDYYEFELNGVIEVPMIQVGDLLRLSLNQFDDLSEDELFKMLQYIPEHLWFNLQRINSSQSRALVRQNISIDKSRYQPSVPRLGAVLNDQSRFRYGKVGASPIETTIPIPAVERQRFAEVMNWVEVNDQPWDGDGASTFRKEFQLIQDLINVVYDVETFKQRERSGLSTFNQDIINHIKSLTDIIYVSIVKRVETLPPISLHYKIPFDTLQGLFVEFLHIWCIKWQGCTTQNADNSITIRLPIRSRAVSIPAKRRAIQ